MEPPVWERREALPATTRAGRPLLLFAGLAGGLVAGFASVLLGVVGMIVAAGSFTPPTPTEQALGVAMMTLSGLSLAAAAASVTAAVGAASAGRMFTRVAVVAGSLGLLSGVALVVIF